MEPRMRAGMIAGAGAAVAAFFLSFVVFCLGGLLVAIISGLSAGLQIARDQRFAREAGAAGALAGLYAGVVLGVGQILGMLLTAALFRDQLQAQLASQGYSNNLFWPTLIIACLFVGALEVGITVGGGALAAFYAARRLYGVAAASVLRYAPTYPPAYAPVPLPDATPAPAPPPARPLPPYPPPPSFYGAPPKGVTSVDDNSADASPATAEM